MFIFVASNTICFILFFPEHKRGAIFKGGQTRIKLWYRCKEILTNQVFDSTHKENIKKTRETITPIADTKKLCVSKYSIERSQRHHKKSSRSRKSGLTNSGNLVELLQHRVEGGTKNLKNQLQNAS